MAAVLLFLSNLVHKVFSFSNMALETRTNMAEVTSCVKRSWLIANDVSVTNLHCLPDFQHFNDKRQIKVRNSLNVNSNRPFPRSPGPLY